MKYISEVEADQVISRGSRFARVYERLPPSLRWIFGAVGAVSVGFVLLWATADAGELSDLLWLGLAVVVLLGSAALLRVRVQIQAAHRERTSLRLQQAANQLQSGTLLTRLDAIRTLEEIGASSATHHSRTMDVLAAFLREDALWEEPEVNGLREEVSGSGPLPTACRPDIERALDAVARPRGADPEKEGAFVLNLSRIDLRMVGLVAAHLEGADLQQSHLEGAELWKAHLEGSNLSGVHLDGANLSQAHLEGANLEETYLRGANLQFAELQGAQLGKADLSGARLTLAHLEGADLSDAVGLTSNQLREAYRDRNTRLPDYLEELCKEES